MKRGRLFAGIALLVMAAVVYLYNQSGDTYTITIVLIGLGVTMIVLALRR